MPDLITVSVTAEDLACGWEYMVSPAPDKPDRRGCELCPLEHALTRAVCAEVHTQGEQIWLASSTQKEGPVDCVVLPDDVREKIRRIDKGLPVKPFTFDIERPR